MMELQSLLAAGIAADATLATRLFDQSALDSAAPLRHSF